MIRYLLGLLSEEENTQFEGEYFADDQVFEELQVAEAELIDSYVRGELSEYQKQQFLSFYLNSAERRQKLEDAECLMAALAETPAQKPDGEGARPFWSWAVQASRSVPLSMRLGYAMAAIAVLAFASITVVQNRTLRSEVGRLHTEEAGVLKRNQELEQVVKNNAAEREEAKGPHRDTATPESTQSLIAALSLKADLSRGEGTRTSNELIIPRTARLVMLSLSLDSNEHYPHYVVIVETADGSELVRMDQLTSKIGSNGGKVVEVGIQAEVLGSDAYVVRVLGVTTHGKQENVNDYSFQVARP
jgi:hypothetical protein